MGRRRESGAGAPAQLMARNSFRAGGLSFSIKGLSDLDKALKELPKSTQTTVMRNALKRIAEPIAKLARAKVRVRTGATYKSIKVVALRKTDVGKKEFAAAMRSGQGTAAAVEAMRTARRNAKGEGSVMQVAVTTGNMPQAIFLERGTSRQRAYPFMRPAFDEREVTSQRDLAKALKTEIEKARKRLAAKAEREAAKIKTQR